jgi:hypothetical protein
MNERHLFRGKRIDSGEWITGGPARRKSRFAPQLKTAFGISDEFGVFTAVDPSTVGQCTGLRAAKSYRGDKPEDLLIFEGDIVQGKRGIGHIKWHDKGLTGWLVEYPDCRELVYSDNRQDYEIIGNIHDNPELLEV